jgi:hypothetical protein
MTNPNFAPITDAQREQAKQQRLVDQEFARNNLKVIYTDQPHWVTLASKYNCKLPMWWKPSSDVKYLRRVAKKANFDLNVFVESTGCSNIKEYAELNSNWSVLGLVGTLLEFIDEQKTSESKQYTIS